MFASLKMLASRIGGRFSRRRVDQDFEKELSAHLEMLTQENIQRGMSLAEANRMAHVRLGGITQLQETNRELRGLPMLDTFMQDIRYALRMLRKNPGFTAIAVLTLAFGIGANSAIFAAVDTLTLRPLPYSNPERIVTIGSREAHHPETAEWISAPALFDLQDGASSFSSVVGISPVWNNIVMGRENAERLESLYVSAEFFPLLGVQPVIGRAFRADEDNRTKGANVVVLSYTYWQRRFGGDPGVVGQTLGVSNISFTIVGVLPRDFLYLGEPVAGTPSQIDLWMPLATNPLIARARSVRFLKAIGQTKVGVSVAQAQQEIVRIGGTFAEQYPETDAGLEFNTAPLSTAVSGRLRPMMLLLLGAVGFVLLMACANVANLLLTMAGARGKELAVRTALGASRSRLLRQFLTESALLGGLGGVAGVVIAYGALRGLNVLSPATLVQGRTIHLDARALIFTTVAILLSALISGLPPALRILRSDAGISLREAGRGFTGGHHRFRSALVVAQMSLALALLVGAGLFIRGFIKLLDVNPGFDVQHVATFSTQFPFTTATTTPQAVAADRELIEHLRQVPGVREIGAISRLPLLGTSLGSTLWIEGRSFSAQNYRSIEYRVASPGYFPAMGIPLISGRLFDDHDDANAKGVAVIDQEAARQFWGGQDPVGRHIKLGPNPEKQEWITVIGVVGNVHHVGLDLQPVAEVYRPIGFSALGSPIIVARSEGTPESLLPTLATAMRSYNSSLPIYNSFSMETLVARSVAQRRFMMMLLAGFAGAALFLAAIGIYGTISQSVAQRTREMGLRIALGAHPRDVLKMVLGQAMQLAALGILIGGLSAAALTRLIRSLLFEVSPFDATVFFVAAVTLCAVALLACFAPALRATRVDPLVALRDE
jgi:predicted permease